jgi:hypothetical protein
MSHLSGQALIHAPLGEVYRKLLEPSEQLRWNSLYLAVQVQPSGEITNQTVMTGTFKGSGKATVSFEKIIRDQEFTHRSQMKLFEVIVLGEFQHRYEVVARGGHTLVTQTVTFEPRGLGKLLERVILEGFRKRLPESFTELGRYAQSA